MTNPELQLSAQQLTSTTRVIVSFGARDGGFELTAQLRLDIMDRYGKRRIVRRPDGGFLRTESDDSFCYLDAVTLAQAPGTTYEKLTMDKGFGKQNPKAVDLNKMANPYWDTYYPQAVANAAVMIFQITTPWLKSEFCLEEFAWFIVQSVRNLESGRPVTCIFMVFEEAKAGFAQLLGQLRLGLATRPPSGCMTGYPYARMLQALGTLASYSAVLQNPAILVPLRSRFNALLTIMTERCVDVPPGFAELGFTDHYDAAQQRIELDTAASRPAATAYTHQFNYKYGMVADFEARLFEILDADLAKAGVNRV